ncbi:hypothetical protein [Mycobacterium sp. E3298]|uniref:hypothetical protein n=1 Tax=Mycobacterium sp. E3298 TaxID=1856865 RepID=UPI0012EA9AB0|nr:hypothetical protein [Mycobacterium sp. E3298]
MTDMPNPQNAEKAMEALADAAVLYERYLELSGVTSVASITQRREHITPLPAPMTITIS